ncbi:helix-turn-helix domain-containing protein [Streptomyces roseolilacinus]|uniref:AraC family transcriptional regulator n=1 Tax=Streptomyces roseolilacinus TaxID=66904 RepID=A0A918EK03_9ACTN|nr:helix-turn-helix domain-containing protein [Streptomyces roseolilacinus]GGQ09985.1 AraC family transcriptional regulator [Streptomyces roseolilacinus]
MIISEFSSGHLTGDDQIAYWEDVGARSAMAARLTPVAGDGLTAHCRILDLGRLQVFVQSYPALSAHRSATMVRQSDPEVLHLWLTAGGGLSISQGREELTAAEGDFVVYDSSGPLRGRHTPSEQAGASLMIQVPRAELPLPPAALGPARPTRICGRTGVGALLGSHVRELASRTEEFAGSGSPFLGDATLSLVTGALARTRGVETRRLPEPARQSVLRECVKRFIGNHLGDPELTPARIAAAHHISLRYLHKLFEDEDHTVADRIRTLRLRMIRHDLSDPALAARPVYRVAARWGLTDPTYASKAFRATFGLTPSEHRRRVLGSRAVR